MYRWLVNEGVLRRNPVADIHPVVPRPRSGTITPEEHRRLIECASREFRLVLIAATCGMRPQQIREVTVEDVLPDYSAWVMHRHKTAHVTGKPIVVYLSPCLSTLTRLLVGSRRSGHLFLNKDGKPWKKDAIVRNMARLRKRAGVSSDKVLYSYRHTFATNALMADVPIQSVSALLGHSDTRMVSKVYGHLDQHRHHLAEVARAAHQVRHNQPLCGRDDKPAG
jgi:integrase